MSGHEYTKVPNWPRYKYDNTIIIAANVIILEFLFSRFVHPGAPLPFYLFLTQVTT